MDAPVFWPIGAVCMVGAGRAALAIVRTLRRRRRRGHDRHIIDQLRDRVTTIRAGEAGEETGRWGVGA